MAQNLTPEQQIKYDNAITRMEECGKTGHQLTHHRNYVSCVCGYTDAAIMPTQYFH